MSSTRYRPTSPEPPEGHEPGERASEPDVERSAARRAWARLFLIARPRATRANVFALLLALGLGFAIATQVRQTQEQGLEELRQDELVRILDDVSQNGSRLEDEIAELERTRDGLIEGGGSQEAIDAAQERIDTLGILAGTEPATGPGIRLTITDPDQMLDAATLLDTVQELRDAGAEAMQVGDVRIVASTHFTDVGGQVEADGTRLQAPYELLVIGDPRTMSSALEIPGGVAENVRGKGGEARIEELDTVDVTALHTVSAPRYAQPVPEPSDDDSP